MTDLTEHGKPQLYGYYYVEFNNGKQGIKQFGEFANTWTPKKTFCEVPSYEEYQSLLSDQLAKNEGEEINAELTERLKKTQELELELRKENTKLKELLKECKHIMSIEKDFASCHFEKDKLCKLLTKINQVLGEE